MKPKSAEELAREHAYKVTDAKNLPTAFDNATASFLAGHQSREPEIAEWKEKYIAARLSGAMEGREELAQENAALIDCLKQFEKVTSANFDEWEFLRQEVLAKYNAPSDVKATGGIE